jgi:tetratricopeptide (TPR) repeat protein
MGMRFCIWRSLSCLAPKSLCSKVTGGVLATVLLVGSLETRAGEFEDCQKKFLKGDYEEAVRLAEKALRADDANQDWSLLLTQALLTLGRYADAETAITKAAARYDDSIRVRLLGYEVLLGNGKPEQAKLLLDEINSLGGRRVWAYRDPPNLVALGRAALLLGADPRLVLDNFFDRAKKADPNCRDAYLASGNVALQKHDFDLAAKVFTEGLKRFADDPDMNFGVAKAFSEGDRSQMKEALEAALEHNPNHLPSLLLLTDHLIDAEEYAKAGEMLEKVLAVNGAHPEAWAYRAVLAHLRSEPTAEEEARNKALEPWKTNPKVDHLIGRKLGQKYRFAESADHQRQALRFDPTFLPAKIQLAQDLLRLGEEGEGWQLADEVHQRDAYDVTAYNLVTLHDTMAKFQAVTNADFVVRMAPKEASIYGNQVLDLLQRAKTNLSVKYGLNLDHPTIIEIFPSPKDFGVRTFGIPDNPGYLGVCFGRVITANSPASQTANPANWEAVLWHEFCHVITLQLTKNKMPRWLSEGISVYEERLANPAWGQEMNPKYREMVLNGDLVPVSKLSGAFLTPKSDLHLQFAYYESSLVVEFLVESFGAESVKKILQDLGAGGEINQVIAKHTTSMDKLEKDFAAFAKERAEKLAPKLDFEKPKQSLVMRDEESWFAFHPNNFWGLTQQAKKLLGQKKWEEAKAPLQKLLEAYPGYTGADNAYVLLASAHRALDELKAEREILTKLASLSADSPDAYLRLMNLASDEKDWKSVKENAERFLAVNPLLPQPYRFLARASEELNESPAAIAAYRILLMLDPPDPAEVHFRLAKLLHAAGDAAAKRHVLQALEEAPRYREAHRLLLEMQRNPIQPKQSAAATLLPPVK